MDNSNRINAVIVFGGLTLVVATGALFMLFPMYRLLDMSVVRRPIWDPPRIVIREAGQGLTQEDVARLEQDPGQKEFLDSLKKPFIYQPKPSWLGHEKWDPNKPPRGRSYPPNRLLYLFAGSVALYIIALKNRGIL